MNRVANFCKTLRIAHVQLLRRYSTTLTTVTIELSECDEALPPEPVAPAPVPAPHAKPPRLDQPSPDAWAIAELLEE